MFPFVYGAQHDPAYWKGTHPDEWDPQRWLDDVNGGVTVGVLFRWLPVHALDYADFDLTRQSGRIIHLEMAREDALERSGDSIAVLFRIGYMMADTVSPPQTRAR